MKEMFGPSLMGKVGVKEGEKWKESELRHKTGAKWRNLCFNFPTYSSHVSFHTFQF